MDESTRKEILGIWNRELSASGMSIVVCTSMPQPDYFSIVAERSVFYKFNSLSLSDEGVDFLSDVLLRTYGDKYELCLNNDRTIFWCMEQ